MAHDGARLVDGAQRLVTQHNDLEQCPRQRISSLLDDCARRLINRRVLHGIPSISLLYGAVWHTSGTVYQPGNHERAIQLRNAVLFSLSERRNAFLGLRCAGEVTGTPDFMAIAVQGGQAATVSTELESLLYIAIKLRVSTRSTGSHRRQTTAMSSSHQCAIRSGSKAR